MKDEESMRCCEYHCTMESCLHPLALGRAPTMSTESQAQIAEMVSEVEGGAPGAAPLGL